MRLTTAKLIFFRLFNLSLGRLEFFNERLKGALIRRLIKSAPEPYAASSRFFDPREL